MKPIVATIQPVNVVPRLAPSTTPTAFSSAMTPAAAKASTISETTELDCSSAVASVPLMTDCSG